MHASPPRATLWVPIDISSRTKPVLDDGERSGDVARAVAGVVELCRVWPYPWISAGEEQSTVILFGSMPASSAAMSVKVLNEDPQGRPPLVPSPVARLTWLAL